MACKVYCSCARVSGVGDFKRIKCILHFFFGYSSEPPKGSGDKVAFDAFNTNKHGWNEPPTLSPYSGASTGIAPVRPTPSAGILALL